MGTGLLNNDKMIVMTILTIACVSPFLWLLLVDESNNSKDSEK